MSDNSLKAGALKSELTKLLTERYGSREATAMVRIMMEDVMGWSQVDIVLKSDYELNELTVNRMRDIAQRIYSGEPIQYVLGSAMFHGLRFKVTANTLIPRPETSELVDIIADENRHKKDLHILDCGTGTGCIAIALGREFPFASVKGIDISDEALKVARENARALRVAVTFEKEDILSLPSDSDAEYNIIVSNPPYITEHEKAGMENNVLDYEPHTALFVPDDAPLMFYEAIGRYGLVALKDGGKLYFEINPLYAVEMVGMLSQQGYDDIAVTRDSQGKKRFVTAVLHRQ